MGVQGVDYAGDHPDPRGLYTVGKRFACRYFGPGGSWKHATKAECQALADAGLFIVTNAEGAANGLLDGFGAGKVWAEQAHDHAVACGMPADRPIYLSVDFDVTAGQWPDVREALKGAAAAIGPARVGVYGGYDAIAWAARDHVARWFWQTYAWSEGRWHPVAHIRQYRNGVSLVGGTVDLDDAVVSQYGQWKPVGASPPGNGGSGMTWTADQINAETWRTEAILTGRDPVDIHIEGRADEPNMLHRRLGEILDRVDSPRADVAEAVAALTESLNVAIARVDAMEDTPAVDPVAVAAAIAAHPEIAATLADAVAARLGRVVGEVTLTGSADLGIRPGTG